MTTNSTVARIAQVLSEKNSISICLPTNPTLDAVAAGTALYIALQALKKNTGLAAPSDVDPNFGLSGQNKIQSSLIADGDNLVVSFPYQEGSVDKVTYNIEAERFNLIIQPREGFPKLNPKQVNFTYTGGKPEAIVTIYAPTLNSLGQLYTANKSQFTGVEIINIDRHFTNANYGSINHVDKKSSSMSEMILSLIQALKAPIDKDIASNLYAGISSATNNFSAHSVTADTFEIAALLLKNGATKRAIVPMGNPMNAMGSSMSNPMGISNPIGNRGMNQGFGAYQQPFAQQSSAQQPFAQQPYMEYPQFPSQQVSQQGMPSVQSIQPMSPMQQSSMQQPPMQEPMDNMSMSQQPMQQPMQPSLQQQTQQSTQMPMTQATEEPMQPFGQVELENELEEHMKIQQPQVEQQQMDQSQEPNNKQNFQNVAGAEMDPQLVENKEIKPKNTPKDWLKPKIFKGTKLS